MMEFESNCRCVCRCTITAVIVSVILGVITVFLQFAGLISVPTALLSAAFIIAAACLLVLAMGTLLRGRVNRNCLCSSLYAVLAGIAGTMLLSVLILITGIAGGVFGSILIGLLVFFFALLIGGAVCLIINEANCEER